MRLIRQLTEGVLSSLQSQFGFTTDFTTLPESPPYGYWVAGDGSFVKVRFESHGQFLVSFLAEYRKSESGVPEIYTDMGSDTDELYHFAFTVLKWIRVNFEAPDLSDASRLYWCANREQRTRPQQSTINDMATHFGIRAVFTRWEEAGG